MVFLPNEVHILASKTKANLFQPMASQCEQEAGVKLVIHTKLKDSDGTEQIQEIIAAITQENPQPIVGHMPKEEHEGKLVQVWQKEIQASGVELVDVTAGFGDLFSVKDSGEILNVKKAAHLAAKVMKDYVVPKLERIVDAEKKVKHVALGTEIEEVITDPSKVQLKLKVDKVDIAYPPIFQSGGRYDLKVSAPNDESHLHDGVILVALGTRYSSYCANISRTYVIDPNKQQEQEYQTILAAQEAAIAALVEGAPMSAAYNAAVAKLRESGNEKLVAGLTKNVGFGMGLELRETQNVLSYKNESLVRPGMVFNVSVGVAGLENPAAKHPKGKVYAFQIADTVVVQEGGKAPELITSYCPKAWQKVSYALDEEDGAAEEEEEEDDVKPTTRQENGNVQHGKKLRSDDPNFKGEEQKRREEQQQLEKEKTEETLRRLTSAANAGTSGDAGAVTRKVSEVVAYRAVADIPQQVKDLIIQVDSKNETVLLPLYGVMVPFHILTIKAITSNQDNEHAHVRITFNCTGNYEPVLRYPNAVFLKELSFRTPDNRHAQKVVQEVKVLKGQVAQRDKERAERATLVQQEKLVKSKTPRRLVDLWVRPGLGGKGRKVTGALEAHVNGLRYSNAKGEGIDVMYRNIKHAFFQPAENDMITILHFHLHNSIMVGNKKTNDVQFYCEVMDVVQTLDAGRRSAYDPDELEEEQRERDKRKKINSEFKAFIGRLNEQWEREYPQLDLEFDIPFRELGFHGVAFRSTSYIMPTAYCLVELTEMPFLVVALKDIEVVNLERVGFNLKNFDMAIVFKDFTRDVLRVDAIPAKSLDNIKNWLTSMKIKYYESKLNLNWKVILKDILQDPQNFADQGGWSFLDVDKADSDESDPEDATEDYAPEESSDDEEDSDDSDSEDQSLVDSDAEDEDASGSEEEEEDEGLTWEELEEEAKKDDNERGSEGDSDDEPRGKKRKAQPSSGGGAAKGGAAKGGPARGGPPGRGGPPAKGGGPSRPAPPAAKKVRR